MVRIVEVVPYDPGWPRQYLLASARVNDIFSPNVVVMHLIGSTASEHTSTKTGFIREVDRQAAAWRRGVEGPQHGSTG